MENRIKGFSIIELMITVAVIGILASLAIPAYSDYTVRARVSDGLAMAAPMQIQIAQQYIDEGAITGSTNEDYGLKASGSYSTNSVEGISVGENGVITVTYSSIGGDADQKTVLFIPRPSLNVLNWSCAPGTMPTKYLPPNCRNSFYVASSSASGQSGSASAAGSSASASATESSSTESASSTETASTASSSKAAGKPEKTKKTKKAKE